MVNGKLFCHSAVLLLSLCFMAAKCSVESTDQFSDSATDTKQDALMLHKRPSFFVGSRYGRSGSSPSGPSAFATSKTRRLNVVPRNDRFFLSSRYGKRAEISTGTQLSSKSMPSQFYDDLQQTPSSRSPSLASAVPPYAYMSCLYTGLQNYYRCNSIYSGLYLKNALLNENSNGAALLNNSHDNDDDSDDDDNDNDDADENDEK